VLPKFLPAGTAGITEHWADPFPLVLPWLRVTPWTLLQSMMGLTFRWLCHYWFLIHRMKLIWFAFVILV
jgi:hypothetical protein